MRNHCPLTASDLTSRLDNLSKQLKEQSIKEKNTSQEAPSRNQARTIIPPTHKAYSGDRRYNVVIFSVAENSSGAPRTSRTKKDIKACTEILQHTNTDFNFHSIRDYFRLGKYSITQLDPDHDPYLLNWLELLMLTWCYITGLKPPMDS